MNLEFLAPVVKRKSWLLFTYWAEASRLDGGLFALARVSKREKSSSWGSHSFPSPVTGRKTFLGSPVLSQLKKNLCSRRPSNCCFYKVLGEFFNNALFYLDNSRKIHLRGARAHRPKDAKRRAPHRAGEREKKRALAPLFICFSVPGPVLCKLGRPGVLFVLPEVLTPVLGPSFVLFSQAFPFQVF